MRTGRACGRELRKYSLGVNERKHPHAEAASDSEPRNGPSLPRLRPGGPTGDPDPEEPPHHLRQELIALQGGRSPPLPASSKVG